MSNFEKQLYEVALLKEETAKELDELAKEAGLDSDSSFESDRNLQIKKNNQ